MARSGLFYRILLLVLIVFTGIYSFSQAIRVPLDRLTADKILHAQNILSGSETIFSDGMHPFELPVYLLCVRIFGLSTFAAIGASVCFFMVLFCTGLYILHRRGLLSPLIGLILLAAAGMPDAFRLTGIQKAPVLIFSLLIFPFFLGNFLENRRIRHAAGAGFSLLLMASAASLPPEEHSYGTIRALLKVFRADFSSQPLLQGETGRYFLNTILLLVTFSVIGLALAGVFRRHPSGPFTLTYAAAMLITLLYVFLPFRIGNGQKDILFSWLPFGAAILTASAYESSALKSSRFLQYRLPLSSAVILFFTAVVFFDLDTVVTSRPPGTADRVTAILQERGLTDGYCAPEDHALFLTASKGRLRLTSDPSDPGNRFCILTESSAETCGEGETIAADPYRVVIIP